MICGTCAGDNLGIVNANYPQKATKDDQRKSGQTLIGQALDQHCPNLQKAMFLTTDQKVGGSNLPRRAIEK